MPTLEEIKRFKTHEKYGVDNKTTSKRPRNGKLIYSYCGKVEVVKTGDFALLNYHKKILINQGYKKEHLSIQYQ